jgi:ATP-dependent helicase/DNAse subunit B
MGRIHLGNNIVSIYITRFSNMPYKTRKRRGKACYTVYNPKSKKVFAKCASMENAQRQMRLLRAIQNNKSFLTKSNSRSRSRQRSTRKNQKQ